MSTSSSISTGLPTLFRFWTEGKANKSNSCNFQNTSPNKCWNSKSMKPFGEPNYFALFCSISASLVSCVLIGRTLNNGIVFYTFTCKSKLTDYWGNKSHFFAMTCKKKLVYRLTGTWSNHAVKRINYDKKKFLLLQPLILLCFCLAERRRGRRVSYFFMRSKIPPEAPSPCDSCVMRLRSKVKK